jgi:hypothetical protein
MAMDPDRFTVLVPEDASGTAHVVATDEWGNENSLTILIAGSSFILTLNTAPPVITWGDVGLVEPGLELEVPVSTSETLTAALHLADGRVIPMVVYSDRFVVTVPADAHGPAQVVATGEYGNHADLAITIAGQPPPPPPPPQVSGGGLPQWLRRGGVSSGTELRFTSRTIVRRGQARPAGLHTHSTTRVRRGSVYVSSLDIQARWSTRARGAVATGSLRDTSSTAIDRARPDDPGSEDGLVIFGLI